jgi:hypothetical protein
MRPLDEFWAELSHTGRGRQRSAQDLADVKQPEGESLTGESDGEDKVRGLTRLVLWRVLTDLGADRRPDENVTLGIREACDAARTHGFHAEDLLILVKESWRELSDTQFVARHDDRAGKAHHEAQLRRDEALNAIISMCIREFYRPDSRQ